MLKIAGKLQALGELAPEDIPSAGGRMSAVLALPDGRTVTITGLTNEEYRKLVGDFGEPMTLKLEGLPC